MLLIGAIALSASASYSSSGAETVKTELNIPDFSVEDGITVENHVTCNAGYTLEQVTIEASFSCAEQEVIPLLVIGKEVNTSRLNDKNTPITNTLFSRKPYSNRYIMYGNYFHYKTHRYA